MKTTIPTTRYIQLLEAENELLKIRVFSARRSGCKLTNVTQQIQATGVTVKQWSKQHGFDYQAVRNVICGNRTNLMIEAALKADGFMEG